MFQYIHPIYIAILLLAVTSASKLISIKDQQQSVELQSFTASSAENINSIFKSGGLLFNISSYVQNKAPSESWKATDGGAGSVVSMISMLGVEEGMAKIEQPLVISKLVIPKKYLYQRRIPDMEDRIIIAAKDMLKASQTLTTSTVLSLRDLVNLYDVMIGELAPISDVQHKFNQGRAAFIYHDSIARTALRLAKGVPIEGACPAHQAYDFQGLFACQQEYSHHAKKVLSSQLLDCKDVECVKKIQRYLAHLLDQNTGDLGFEEAAHLAEDFLGLGVGNNSQLAEDIARLIACGNISCIEPGCKSFVYTEGWFIYGADWGCCGDYMGCCFLATEVCLVHDAVCTCCSFPTFCLDPFCKPDAWCSNLTTTASPPFG